MSKYLVINGPNLNLLGTREPEVYGHETLEEVIEYTEGKLSSKNIEIEWFQSNIEGEIIDKIQSCLKTPIDALIINPAAYTHTSVAILDALKSLSCDIVEVHLSNTNAREDYRKKKLTTEQATYVIEGFGKSSYYLAINSHFLKKEE